MIRFKKSGPVPSILRNQGVKKTAEYCAAFDAEPHDYQTGAKTFDFDKKVYGAAAVKNALRKAQRDKCAFCESRVSHVSYGDVEHFRPKAGFVQREGDALERPGYYWLAYEWSNLFFCCQLCNQRFKRNLFPLRDPGKRVRDHRDKHKLASEEALLIDPTKVDPAGHIRWRGEYPKAAPDSEAGRVTIEILGLDRPELVQQRRKHLRLLECLRDSLAEYREQQRQAPLSPKAKRRLAKLEAQAGTLTRDDAEYAAMARQVFAGT
jgi:uncharacterized protein (TIGR02646 family)